MCTPLSRAWILYTFNHRPYLLCKDEILLILLGVNFIPIMEDNSMIESPVLQIPILYTLTVKYNEECLKSASSTTVTNDHNNRFGYLNTM